MQDSTKNWYCILLECNAYFTATINKLDLLAIAI